MAHTGLMFRYWTEKEIDFLKESYFGMHIRKIEKKLGRTLKAINHKANRLGLKRGREIRVVQLREIDRGYMKTSVYDKAREALIQRSKKFCYSKGSKRTAIQRKRQSEARKMFYKNNLPARIRLISNILDHIHKPTKPERDFLALVEKFNLPYKYVGNGEKWIAGKNPDFININHEKKAIEIFGSYWHNPKVNPNVPYKYTEEERVRRFGKNGWKCLVIWDYELEDEKLALQKVRAFNV